MTDDDVFSAICADFPFNSATLDMLRSRLDALHTKASGPKRDYSISPAGVELLRRLEHSMRSLIRDMQALEQWDDSDDIPF